MHLTNLILKLLLLLSTIYLQVILCCEIYHFVSSDEVLRDHVIKTISASFVNFCWNDCVWLPWCFSINVRKTSEGTFECELNNSSKKANPGKMAARPGWSYHEMKDVEKANCKLYDCKRKEDLGDGWRRYGDAAIKLFTEKKNWTDARSHCQSLGGDLLSITSSHENEFVNDVFVENLNLTYIQEDRAISSQFVHYKLNGEDPDVHLNGTPGDTKYQLDERETALYFNGQKGFVEIPAIELGWYAILFWIKPLNSTEQWYYPLSFWKDGQFTLRISLETILSRIYYYVNMGSSVFKHMGRTNAASNTWQHIAIIWSTGHKYFFKNGKLYGMNNQTSPYNITVNHTFLLGYQAPVFLNNKELAFHGYLKHLIFIHKPKRLDIQTAMYWQEQGVWIGLNDLANTNHFTWSDGTPDGFTNLPSYNPKPVKSGRKCIAMAKDKKWLDKHCHLKYPFLCEKPAPPA